MSSRSRAGGLPSGPGPRSRSVARTRENSDRGRYEEDSDAPASSRSSARQIRPQKSMTSMNQTRTDPRPPMPSSRSRRPAYDTRSDSGTNRSSDTSTTSSGSSFLDRMKQTAGYASSRTSFEDDEPDYKRPARFARSRPLREDSPPPDNEPGNETGDTLWSRIATTASSLTVNVSKAWATNITTFAGEETPPGQESRLTRAMKAYHLEKARDPSDLPAWLFDEKERRRPEPEPSRSRRRRDDDDDYEVVEKKRAEPPPSRGLRDIYEAAAASSSPSSTAATRSTRGARSYADDSPQPSKATDRLKAIRDAKRGAVNSSWRDEEPVRDAPRAEPEPAPPARRRVGLPSGPVSRRI